MIFILKVNVQHDRMTVQFIFNLFKASLFSMLPLGLETGDVTLERRTISATDFKCYFQSSSSVFLFEI